MSVPVPFTGGRACGAIRYEGCADLRRSKVRDYLPEHEKIPSR